MRFGCMGGPCAGWVALTHCLGFAARPSRPVARNGGPHHFFSRQQRLQSLQISALRSLLRGPPPTCAPHAWLQAITRALVASVPVRLLVGGWTGVALLGAARAREQLAAGECRPRAQHDPRRAVTAAVLLFMNGCAPGGATTPAPWRRSAVDSPGFPATWVEGRCAHVRRGQMQTQGRQPAGG